MDLARILPEAEGDAVHGRVAPSLVEEAAGVVEVVKVVLVDGAPPKVHVSHLKVAPEVTGRVSLGLLVVLGPAHVVGQPPEGALLVDGILWVVGQELYRLGPQGGQRLGVVVEGDCEAVRLVVVVHVGEDVVVDVAEEVHLGLDAPVVARVAQGRVLVEHAAVPAAHLVVGYLVCVLHAAVLEHARRLVVDLLVDPRRRRPVLARDLLVDALCPRHRLRLALELLGKGLVVEKGPGVVELVVPRPLQVLHRLHHVVDLFVSHQRQQRGGDPGAVGGVGGIPLGGAAQYPLWFSRGCEARLA